MKRFFTICLSLFFAGMLRAQPTWTSLYIDHWDDNAWEAIFLDVNSLNAQGRIDTSFSYETYQGNWSLNHIVLHDYDALGRLEQQLFEYQQSGVLWGHKFEYDYGLNGLLNEKRLYHRTNDASPWEVLMRTDYIYNAQDKLYRETVSVFDDGELVSASRYTYYYNAQGRLEEVLLELSEDQPGWEPYQRWIYSYDSGPLPEQRLDRQWSEMTQTWRDKSLWHYVYNPDGSIAVETEQDWDALQAEWVNLFRYRYYYGVLTVDETAALLPELYPNPVVGELHVTFGQQLHATLTITDLAGKTLLQEAVSGTQHQLDVTALPAGIYLLQVDAAGKTSVHKFVKS